MDHAWTFELKHARQHLAMIPSLLERMCQLMTVDLDSLGTERAVDLVMRRIWRQVMFSFSVGVLVLSVSLCLF